MSPTRFDYPFPSDKRAFITSATSATTSPWKLISAVEGPALLSVKLHLRIVRTTTTGDRKNRHQSLLVVLMLSSSYCLQNAGGRIDHIYGSNSAKRITSPRPAGEFLFTNQRNKGEPAPRLCLKSGASHCLRRGYGSVVSAALPVRVDNVQPKDTADTDADLASVAESALADQAVGGRPVLDADISPAPVETSDHWRKNLPVLGQSHRVFAIDLLGYGYSDKPDPKGQPPNTLYTFETWGRQTLDFLDDVVGGPAFLICNSVGGLAGLQAALDAPPKVLGLLLLNISLRQLHIKKQQWFAKPFVKALQTTLRTTDIGKVFFKSVAKPQAIKNILRQCYHDKEQVTDELVEVILEPGLRAGAVDVFLDFICYSGGPLPEEMLPLVKCPVVIGWGEEDPWEPIKLGRAYGEIGTVKEFVVLPGVGHCPQDEAPHLVNPLIKRFVAEYS